jgi:hypothetical protein
VIQILFNSIWIYFFDFAYGPSFNGNFRDFNFLFGDGSFTENKETIYKKFMDCDKCWTCRIGNALNICDDTAETTSIISNQCSFCGEN